ncbi:MAG: hypothetical protein KI792_04755 [Alphaproteobacteria bacterium]|nr:hypothetical protein [Alphaproteobacteria bacterium SS10]
MTDINGISLLHIAEAPSSRQSLAEYAEMLGWSVHSTTDHAHGLAIAGKTRFDAIITEGDGASSLDGALSTEAFAKQLRGPGSPNHRTPIILSDRATSQQSVGELFDGVLNAPIGLNSLREVIMDALDERVFVGP